MDNSLYLVFVEFNPAKELKYKQNDIDNYNTWLYLRCNKHKPKIAPENTVAVGFASHDWLFNRGKMLGITIDGKLKMVDLTYHNYDIRPTYKITDGITNRSYLPTNSVYTRNGNHKFTYYKLHFMDLKRVTQYWNNIRSNTKNIPRSNLEIELNLCHPNPMPYAYKDLIDTKGPKWASPYKNLIDIKGAEWAGYLADFPIEYCKDYDTLVTMALAKNKLYLNPDKGEPSMADGVNVRPNDASISLQINGEVRGVFNVDQENDQIIDLGNYSTTTPSNCTITIKSNGKYLGSFTLNQDNDSMIDIGDFSHFATKTELASKANTSDLSTVATSGSYNDLLDKPTSFDVDLSNYYTKSEIDNLLSHNAQWYATYPDGAEAHNAMWGGRDITAAFNNGTVSTNIANGTFRDIFPGDYITKQITIPQVLADDGTTELFAGGTYTVNWVITDCDYWINKGDTTTTVHHVAIVPQQPIFDTYMNLVSTTEGGYAGSEMFKNIIPACATSIVNAFGNDHILTFRDHLTQDLNTSAVSSGITAYTGASGWNGALYSQQCNLMSEAMVYDGPHCASSAFDNIMATRQMSAFRLSERLINYDRHWWWLRDVVSSESFALVHNSGTTNMGSAFGVYGVRPFALLV